LKAIISDIHANLEALRAVLEDARQLGASEIICLGDVVGYGPNPKECIDLAMDFDVVLRGNHEQALMTEFEGSDFNDRAKNSLNWTREQLSPLNEDREANVKRWDFLDRLPKTHTEGNVLYVHGTPRDPILEYVYARDVLRPQKLRSIFEQIEWLCFCGHSHSPGIWTSDMVYLTPREVKYRYRPVKEKTIVNVGSVGQPRDRDPRATYVLFDGTRIAYRKVEYDARITAQKIRSIPEVDPFLGERLLEGR